MASVINLRKGKQPFQCDAPPFTAKPAPTPQACAIADLENRLDFLKDYEHVTLCAPLRTSLCLPAFNRFILTPSEQEDMRNSFEEMKEVLTVGPVIHGVRAMERAEALLRQRLLAQVAETSATDTLKSDKGKGKEKITAQTHLPSPSGPIVVDSVQNNSKSSCSHDTGNDKASGTSAVAKSKSPLETQAMRRVGWVSFDLREAQMLYDPQVDSDHYLRWVKDPHNERRWERKVFNRKRDGYEPWPVGGAVPTTLLKVGNHWFESPGPDLDTACVEKGTWYPKSAPNDSNFDCRKVVWLDEPSGLKRDGCKLLGCSHADLPTAYALIQTDDMARDSRKKRPAVHFVDEVSEPVCLASSSTPFAPQIASFAPISEDVDEEDGETGWRPRKRAKVTDPAYRYTRPDSEQEAADDALRPDFNDINPAKPGKIVDPTFKPQVEDEEIESPVKETKKRKTTPRKGGKKNAVDTSGAGDLGMETPVNTPVAGPSTTTTPAKKRETPSRKASTPKMTPTCAMKAASNTTAEDGEAEVEEEKVTCPKANTSVKRPATGRVSKSVKKPPAKKSPAAKSKAA